MKVKIDVDTDEFDEKIERSQKKVDALLGSTRRLGLKGLTMASYGRKCKIED